MAIPLRNSYSIPILKTSQDLKLIVVVVEYNCSWMLLKDLKQLKLPISRGVRDLSKDVTVPSSVLNGLLLVRIQLSSDDILIAENIIVTIDVFMMALGWPFEVHID